MTETMQYNQAGHVNRQSDTFHTGRGSAAHHGGIGPAARIASWRWKPRVAHIQNAAILCLTKQRELERVEIARKNRDDIEAHRSYSA